MLGHAGFCRFRASPSPARVRGAEPAGSGEESPVRYEGLTNIVKLAIRMQGLRGGGPRRMCVDAPFDASIFSVGSAHAVRCCRVSGLSMRHVTRRGPSWRCADRVHIAYASSKALHPEAGFPDPVSIDRLPLPFLRPARVPDSYPLCRSLRRLREPGNSPSSSSAPTRCAPSGWPTPRRPASSACASASWRATGRSSGPAEPPSGRPPWRP